LNIVVPELSLVLLIGPSGCGKSTFARKHFKPTEVLSSDYCRGLIADDENDQSATKTAFEVLHFIAGKRLAAGRLAVIDATNVQRESRKSLLALAKQYHVLPTAIVFDLPEHVCVDRNRLRTDRDFGSHVIHTQRRDLLRDLRHLERDGFRYVHTLRSAEDVEAAKIVRQPLWNNRKNDHGPFDIIGDIHGCFEELTELLEKLGYLIEQEEETFRASHPESRKAIFAGDLVDRGPDIPNVLRLAMAMTHSGGALCVPGNHDMKLLRKLRGRDVPVTHGLADSLQQLEKEPPTFIEEVKEFLDGLVSHYVLDNGKLVVAHAGLKEELQGRGSAAVREFALFGETTGETDEFGLPVRLNWAAHYRGRAQVVYGHTPVAQPEWLNRTINIDTGCVFGGSLTALRYPEKELVSVPARRTYYQSVRPFLPPEGAALAQRPADVLDIDDVSGKRLIETRFHHPVTIREENAAAALEAISRFAVDPRWLMYLPPTMSPPETSRREGLLEHPDEAFAYYRKQEVTSAVCQQKHMGSRVVIVLCREAGVVRGRFGIDSDIDSSTLGICYTRTGRPFFSDTAFERALLARLNEAMIASGLWDHLQTDWVCLDAELMPWSQKAQELLERQYAATGSAAQASLSAAIAVLQAATSPDTAPLLEQYRARLADVQAYVEAYRRYCWPVQGLGDLRLAPFHLLASEGRAYAEQDHLWHMNTLARLCAAAPELLLPTPFRVVDLNDQGSVAGAVQWWEDLTSAGGEGMVVKPLSFLQRGKRGLVQPAVKCRGREYLRLIYGPEYTDPNYLNRLRERNVGMKRSLALREFALGLEALERFTAREPLYRVHECVFGILALESEPVDPRL
jgi:protein phosphatase